MRQFPAWAAALPLTAVPASHVFGTLHVDDPRVTKLPQAVVREFDEAHSLHGM